MSEKITKTESDLLSSAIEKIINTEVLEKDISGKIPKTDDLHDSNKVYTGKVSILFVDMRNSTQLPAQFDSEQLVKIYGVLFNKDKTMLIQYPAGSTEIN